MSDELIELKQYYPETLEKMPAEFDSHQFIMALAQAHQVEYVRALFANVDVSDGGVFRALHGQLSKALHEHADYLEDRNSKDIFGNSGSNAVWRKR